MIIKSMSRKSKSFSQLYDYLMRDNSFSFSRNTYSHSTNKKDLIREFMRNSDYLKTSRGKNYLYHELLSLEENNLSAEKQKEILLDLANKYLESRAKNHLAIGVFHTDKNHLHIHLMISANEIEGTKRVRISKKEFSSIQKNLENYKNERYKELSISSHYQKTKDLNKEKQIEQEIKNRRNKTTIKDDIKKDLEELFNKATSKTYIENYLKNKGYEIYTRGQTKGVIYENKKYRFKTLGLDKLYDSKLKELDKIKDRELRREKQKQDRSFSRENTRTRWKEKLNKITKRSIKQSKK